VTKACTSVFTDSTSSERWTRLSWRSQKKHFAHTLETCLSRLRSDVIVTPRTRMWSLAATVSVPSCSDGPPLPNSAGYMPSSCTIVSKQVSKTSIYIAHRRETSNALILILVLKGIQRRTGPDSRVLYFQTWH